MGRDDKAVLQGSSCTLVNLVLAVSFLIARDRFQLSLPAQLYLSLVHSCAQCVAESRQHTIQAVHTSLFISQISEM